MDESEGQREFVVVLRVRTADGNPKKWDWGTLLDGEAVLLSANRGDELGPYCPCCQRRLHRDRKEKAHPCLLCGKPVERTGMPGRPRKLHPECRRPREALLTDKRERKAKL